METCFPVEDPKLKKRVISESFDNYLSDNTHAWQMTAEGSYRAAAARGKKRSAQDNLLQDLSDLNQA